MTTRTLFRSIDGETCGKTSDRFFETQRQRHLDVSTAFGLRPRRFAFSPAAAEQVGKDVPKAAACATLIRRRTKVESGKIESWSSARVGRAGRTCLSRVCEIVGILTEAIVNLALLGIRKNIERF